MRSSSKAMDLAERLLGEIILTAQPGKMLPPERELAKQLGASRNTVRRAIKELHANGWLTPIHGHGHRITQPQREEDHAIGVLCAVPAHMRDEPFWRNVFHGIALAAEADKRHVLMFSNFMTGSDRAIWPAGVRRAESLIAAGVCDLGVLGRLAEIAPTACLGMECHLPGISSACFDHAGSIRMAVKYLQDLGHRRIALCTRTTGPEPNIPARLAGYRTAMRWRDDEDVERLIYPVLAQRRTESTLAPLLNLPPARRPTALIVADLFWPIAATLTQAGLRIPEDLSVVHVGQWTSYSDWFYLSSTVGGGELGLLTSGAGTATSGLAGLCPTTVHLSAVHMGSWAVQELARRRTGPGKSPQHHVFPPQLQVGNTVARCK